MPFTKEEVESEFDLMQSLFNARIAKDVTVRTGATVVVRADDKLDGPRVAYKARHGIATELGRIKAALLAGERPERLGKRWRQAAKELGIDLERAATTCST